MKKKNRQQNTHKYTNFVRSMQSEKNSIHRMIRAKMKTKNQNEKAEEEEEG